MGHPPKVVVVVPFRANREDHRFCFCLSNSQHSLAEVATFRSAPSGRDDPPRAAAFLPHGCCSTKATGSHRVQRRRRRQGGEIQFGSAQQSRGGLSHAPGKVWTTNIQEQLNNLSPSHVPSPSNFSFFVTLQEEARAFSLPHSSSISLSRSCVRVLLL